MLPRELPRRFKSTTDGKDGKPFYGVYFPGTDLVIGQMGGRGTGCPTKDIEWIDEEPEISLKLKEQASRRLSDEN
jgi:hypothetical protein